MNIIFNASSIIWLTVMAQCGNEKIALVHFALELGFFLDLSSHTKRHLLLQ
jgi:hypothetical protein